MTTTATKSKRKASSRVKAKPQARKNSETHGAIGEQVLAALTAKPQTTREIVLALGRECGQAQGGPVVAQLHKLTARGIAVASKDGTYPGYCWALAKGKASKPAKAKAKVSA